MNGIAIQDTDTEIWHRDTDSEGSGILVCRGLLRVVPKAVRMKRLPPKGAKLCKTCWAGEAT